MLQPYAETTIATAPDAAPARRVSAMAAGLRGSDILPIAADIRALVAEGREVCNLTVGDFDPAQFPIPRSVASGTAEALRAGETN